MSRQAIRRLFAPPIVMIVAACGGKAAPRPAESAESAACRAHVPGTPCTNEPTCSVEARSCEPDSRTCVGGVWQELRLSTCNPPDPR